MPDGQIQTHFRRCCGGFEPKGGSMEKLNIGDALNKEEARLSKVIEAARKHDKEEFVGEAATLFGSIVSQSKTIGALAGGVARWAFANSSYALMENAISELEGEQAQVAELARIKSIVETAVGQTLVQALESCGTASSAAIEALGGKPQEFAAFRKSVARELGAASAPDISAFNVVVEQLNVHDEGIGVFVNPDSVKRALVRTLNVDGSAKGVSL